MQRSMYAGLDGIDLSAFKKPVVPPKTQDTVPPAPVAPAASQPEPATPAPVATQPEPKPEPAAPAAFQPEPAALGTSAAPLYEGKPRRKAGRPRINPDRPLTSREKAVRYRQRHKALLAEAMSGAANPAEMSHKDLCLAVARMLNQRDNLMLRQTGYPMVKELQRRLKNL